MRQPIVVVLGHVDHGKTAILDYIRRSQIQAREAGGITQHIGATEVPASYIVKFAKPLLEKLGIKITIPGLLFIDTPGHAAFTNLRKRGGSIADLAVLVVDVISGVQPQTVESIEILKQYKVPFVVAANKIDLIPGWKSKEGSFLINLKNQSEQAIWNLDSKIYEIVNKLYELGFESERFDRVSDFTRQVAIVPTSAKTGEGVIDLLAILAGLAQKYLKKRLETTGIARGNILEVRKEKGMGTTIDVILYDGEIREGDTIVVAGKEGPIVTKVRGLFKAEPLKEIRMERKFKRVKEVKAAAGVKILAPNLELALAGGPIRVVRDASRLHEVIEEVQAEVESIEVDGEGVIVKADTLGTLEAFVKMLRERGIKVMYAGIGDVTKQDLMKAKEMREKNEYLGVIFAFNVKNAEEELAKSMEIPVIEGNIIYRLIEEYERWVEEEKRRKSQKLLAELPRPAKFRILPGYVFRSSKPAVVGVEVLAGVLKPHVEVMRLDGREVGYIKQIQFQGQPVKEAARGSKVAVSIEGPTVGRQIKEGDILLVNIDERSYYKLKGLSDLLSKDELEVLEEIAEIKRKTVRKSWGMLPLD